MNEPALNTNANVTAASTHPNVALSAFVDSDNSTKIPAAGTAEPYVVPIEIWLAASSLSRGTRLGTVASFAGSQTRVMASMITVAT